MSKVAAIDLKKVEFKVNPDQILVKVEPPRQPEEELTPSPAEGEEVPEGEEAAIKEDESQAPKEEKSDESQNPKN